jgi:hypothetical protein
VHFYRIEFRRLDGEEFRTKWKDWYPWMVEPSEPAPKLQSRSLWAAKMSEQWPYPPEYDSVLAAPNNYRLLYEDGHVRLLEVAVRPGETTPGHGR